VTLKLKGYTNAPAAITGPNAVSSSDQIGVVKRTNSSSDWIGCGIKGGSNQNTGTHTNSTQSISGGIATAVRSAVSSFSDFAIGINTQPNPLPVTLLYLTAKGVDNSYIQLDWATATEINNQGFDVERSDDGINFTKIGWVDGNNNSSQTLKYRYDDKDVVSNKIYYYRLKQIDYDGQFEYTYIVSALIKEEGVFQLSELVPNPANNKVSIFITTPSEQIIKLKLNDLLGQEIISKEYTMQSGTNGIDIDLRDIPSGTYSVSIISGNIYTSKKLVIAR
jgi:hypothetical protein